MTRSSFAEHVDPRLRGLEGYQSQRRWKGLPEPARRPSLVWPSAYASSFQLSVVAIIFGHLALSEIRKNAGWLTGEGLATANYKMWCWISFGLGLGVFLVYGILAMVGLIGSLHRH